MNKQRIKKGLMIILTSAVALGSFGYWFSHHYVVNLSGSMPGYIYKIKADAATVEIKHNDIVEVCFILNQTARKIDKIMHPGRGGKCPDGTMPYLKRVGALPGDQLKADGIHHLYVNGEQLNGTMPNPNVSYLPHFTFDGTVPKHSVLIYTEHPHSLDSRYFGFVDRNELFYVLEQVF